MDFEVQSKIAKFYKNHKDILKDATTNSIVENEEHLEIIDNNLHLIEEAWMEMEYIKNNKDYYTNFANRYEETKLLQKSGYVIYDLDEYEVNTQDGNGMRNWIYECELYDFKEKLLENKKMIKDIITESKVLSGLAIAMLLR